MSSRRVRASACRRKAPLSAQPDTCCRGLLGCTPRPPPPSTLTLTRTFTLALTPTLPHSDTFSMVRRQMAEAAGDDGSGHRLLHDNCEPPADQTLAAAGVGAGSEMYWVPPVVASAEVSRCAVDISLQTQSMPPLWTRHH